MKWVREGYWLTSSDDLQLPVYHGESKLHTGLKWELPIPIQFITKGLKMTPMLSVEQHFYLTFLFYDTLVFVSISSSKLFML